MKITPPTVAEFLTFKLASIDKSQAEICAELGYPNPNIIALLIKGKTKLPLARVADFAKAIDTDPVHLLRIALTEYAPDVLAIIDQVFDKHVVTEREMEVVRVMRRAACGLNIGPKSGEDVDELCLLCEKWARREVGLIVRNT